MLSDVVVLGENDENFVQAVVMVLIMMIMIIFIPIVVAEVLMNDNVRQQEQL